MQLTHWIDGQARPAASGRWLDVFDPATAQPYAQVAAGDARDVEAAIAAAERAFPMWSTLPNAERAHWMERLADALEARLEDFAQAESRDGGKPIRLARDIEIPRAISNLRFFAHAATQFASESHHGQAGLNYTLRMPLGVDAEKKPDIPSRSLPPCGRRQHCVVPKQRPARFTDGLEAPDGGRL